MQMRGTSGSAVVLVVILLAAVVDHRSGNPTTIPVLLLGEE